MNCIPFLALILCLVATGSGTTSANPPANNVNSNTNIDHNVKTENIKIGNHKTKNYNIHQSNYQPTQLTQLVVNVPKKADKTLRKTRPPTNEEFAIKHRILELWAQARQTMPLQSPQMDHLGRILEALNPKYISTERVVQATFGDPKSFLIYLITLANGGQPPQVLVQPPTTGATDQQPNIIVNQPLPPNAVIPVVATHHHHHQQQQHQPNKPQLARSPSLAAISGQTMNKRMNPRFKDQFIPQQQQQQMNASPQRGR